jgi:hypothetical protein
MLNQLSPPADEPLSLDDDQLIAALIVTARQQAEHRTGRALVSQ